MDDVHIRLEKIEQLVEALRVKVAQFGKVTLTDADTEAKKLGGVEDGDILAALGRLGAFGIRMQFVDLTKDPPQILSADAMRLALLSVIQDPTRTAGENIEVIWAKPGYIPA